MTEVTAITSRRIRKAIVASAGYREPDDPCLEIARALAEQGFLSATAEWMNLHVDITTRRVTPWPAPILDGIRRAAAAQGETAMPADAGRRMHIEKPLYRLGEGRR